jgi:uracil phosphoribosyltransferase
MRDVSTHSALFRNLLSELVQLMMYEATRLFSEEQVEVQTPNMVTQGTRIAREIVLVPILRAGLGMLDGALRMIPFAKVGYVGLARDEKTLEPYKYYEKLPDRLDEAHVILLDPMLATGGSANAAIDGLKQQGALRISLLSLLAVKEGIDAVQGQHPDVDLFIAGCDPILNEHGFIVPGLGDAGDRLFHV